MASRARSGAARESCWRRWRGCGWEALQLGTRGTPNLAKHGGVPSGKRLHSYGKSPFLMGKSTINGHFQ